MNSDEVNIFKKCVKIQENKGKITEKEKALVKKALMHKNEIYHDGEFYPKDIAEQAIDKTKDENPYIRSLFFKYRYDKAMRIALAQYEMLNVAKDLGYEKGIVSCYIMYHIAKKYNVVQYFEESFKDAIKKRFLRETLKNIESFHLT